MALEMMLQYEGFDVWTAKDGEEALARIEREAGDGRHAAVVLTDVKMPKLDGLEGKTLREGRRCKQSDGEESDRDGSEHRRSPRRDASEGCW